MENTTACTCEIGKYAKAHAEREAAPASIPGAFCVVTVLFVSVFGTIAPFALALALSK